MFQTRARRYAWVLGPAAAVTSLAVWALADALATIGPFDRAKVTGFVAAPLFLLSPGATALGVRGLGTTGRRILPIGFGAILGALVAVTLTVATQQFRCVPVTSPAAVLGPSLVVAAAAAFGYSLSLYAAISSATNRRPLYAFAVGAGVLALAVVATLAVYMTEFPALLCAAG